MSGSIKRRLEELEKIYSSAPLIVLAELEDGGLLEMPMKECLERPDAHVVRVVGGSDIKDLDAFLQSIRDEAMKEGNQ